MTARSATREEVLDFVNGNPPGSVAVGWVNKVYARAEQGVATYQYVNLDGDEIIGFGILARFAEGDADPAGWWLAYVWNDPMGPQAWDMAELGIIDFANEGHTFVHGACLGPELCGGRCTPYVGSVDRTNMPYPPGSAGYYRVDREWSLLDTEGSHNRGEAFYMVQKVDTEWKP